MALIYEPAGRAREYAPLALNVYTGCAHACVYCYVPLATKRTKEAFHQPNVRKDYLKNLAREAGKLHTMHRIFMSFTTDPYQMLDVTEQLTRRSIEIFKANGLNFQTLTKGGHRALRDLDLFTPDDAFASSLTLLDPGHSRKWEPLAALPDERMDTLRQFHAAGIPTWVSLEPVINPESTLEIIRRTHEYVDLYKVGTLNYMGEFGKRIDWAGFGHRAVELLDSLGYTRSMAMDGVARIQHGQRMFYVKEDLAKHLSA